MKSNARLAKVFNINSYKIFRIKHITNVLSMNLEKLYELT